MLLSLRRHKPSSFCVRACRSIAVLFFLLLAGALGRAQAGVALVQHTSKDAGVTTSTSLAFVSANTAGNWIAVCIRAGTSSSQGFTVTDSNSNTYRQATQIGFAAAGAGVTLAIYYAENIKGGANTITVSDTVSGPLRFAILEYSGVATANSLDVTAVAQGTSTSPNSGNMSTTASGDLLLGAIVTTNAAVFTAGSGYTIEESVPAEPNTKLITEDQVQAAAGAASASASLAASDNWGAALAAFKAASGGGGTASSITATGGTSQSATVNTAFATPLQATVKDAGNNPVSGVTVTFTAPASGASGTFAGGVNTAKTNTQGVATAGTFTANSTAGGPYNVTASVAGVATSANFSLTNLAATSGGIALVQHTSKDAGVTTSTSLAFVSANTAGNWIAVCIRAGNSSAQVFTVADSNGNTYRQAVQFGQTANPITLAIYYAENIKGGANTITVSDTVSGPLRFAILEYSGIATANSLDVTAAAQGTSASPSSGNATTTGNGDLLLGAIFTAVNPGTFTAGSSYIIEESVPGEPNTKLIVEDLILRTAGSASASASLEVADNWGAALAAFKSASGAAAPISLSVSPTTASVPTGYGTQAFTATLQNDYQQQGVMWSFSGSGCNGNTCGTFSNVTPTSATYNGPANVPNPATVTLTATSVADTTKTALATITVTQGVLKVVISPKRAAVTISPSQTVQFTATAANDPANGGVTWQVDGNNGGNATTGTVSTTGLYTPGTQPGQHSVTAVSVSNASVSASAMVAVTDLTGVFMFHNDTAQTGQNLKEYGLTPATVNSATFGQLFTCPVDGFVYAAPLWVANLSFGTTTRNVVFLATEHDSVYAFDADSPSCVQLWKVSFLGPGVTTVAPNDDGSTSTDIIPEIGITSTPVIDPATNTIYVVPKTKETLGTVNGQACSTASPCFVFRLHALDLLTGSEKFGGPVVISAPNFAPMRQLQRPALVLSSNTVYIAFGSHGDTDPYQGWVMGYDPATLGWKFATALTDPSPGAGVVRGGIWGSGAGPAVDASGNVYVSTGNGAYDGVKNFGDSAVKLSPTGSILDYFTPFNQSILNANDVDLGAAGVLILPDAVGSAAHPHLALATGKIAILYLLDQTNMGKFNSSTNQDVQEVIPVPPPNTTMGSGGIYGLPAYWNGNIYTTGQSFPLSQFHISNGSISTPQFAKSNNTFPPRGATPAVSANGTTNGIVWVLDLSAWFSNGNAILDAYDATNVSTLLFSSPSSGSGAAGRAVKFTVPTVANSKVYVGGQYKLVVFGLFPN